MGGSRIEAELGTRMNKEKVWNIGISMNLKYSLALYKEPRRSFVELFKRLIQLYFKTIKKFDEHKNLSRFKRNGLFLTKNIEKRRFL